MRKILLPGLLIAGLAAGCSKTAAAPEARLRVAAAASLKPVLDELVPAFAAKRAGVRIEVVPSASGTLLSQIENGAPFDVFLSADMDLPRRAAERGFARGEDVFAYAAGTLVLWVPKDSPLDLEKDGVEALRPASAGKVAIANPAHAPYGRAARAAIETAGLEEALEGRLVLGENIAQAAQFAETGAAGAAFLAKSTARLPAMVEKGRFLEVPKALYWAIEQGGVPLSKASDAGRVGWFT